MLNTHLTRPVNNTVLVVSPQVTAMIESWAQDNGRIPATFVLSGISVERAGLLSGPRGEQIAGRYSMVRTGPFPRDARWATLIAAIEGSLRLHRHQPGSLPGLASYLHQRTGGMIGSLLWLVRSAAIEAVTDGTEKITRTSMDAIPVDIASQEKP